MQKKPLIVIFSQNCDRWVIQVQKRNCNWDFITKQTMWQELFKHLATPKLVQIYELS